MTFMPEGDRPLGVAIVAKYLLPAERVVIVHRRHWAVLAGPISITLAGLLVAFALDTGLPPAPLLRDIIWIAWAILLSWFFWHLMEWWFDRFIVTDRRIMLVTGIITRKVAMMPLVKVTDMSYERSLLARMLGYGQFIMESAGQDQALRRVDYVAQPDWLYREMCSLLFPPEPARATGAPASEGGGPTLRPGSEPPSPSGSGGGDEGPRFGPGYGPDDTDVTVPDGAGGGRDGAGAGGGDGAGAGSGAGTDAGGRTTERPASRPSPVTY
jgi:Bacterial PH domain